MFEWVNYFTEEYTITSINNGISDKAIIRKKSSNIEFLVDINNFSFNDGYIEDEQNGIVNCLSIKQQYSSENAETVRKLLTPDEDINDDLNKHKEEVVNRNNFELTLYRENDLGVDLYNINNELKLDENILRKEVFTEPTKTIEIIQTEEIETYKFENKEEETVAIELTSPQTTNDKEIKYLNEKLESYKHQNKIILEENKKLLEVISIFREMQTLEENEREKHKLRDKEYNYNENSLKQFADISTSMNSNKHNKLKPEGNTFTLGNKTNDITSNTNKTSEKVSYINTNGSLSNGSNKKYGDLYRNRKLTTENSKKEREKASSKKETFIRINTNASKGSNCNYYCESSKKSNTNSERLDSNDLIYSSANSIDKVSPAGMSNLKKFESYSEDKNNVIFNKRGVEEEILSTHGEYKEDDKLNYNNIIDILEHYKYMNDTVIKNLTIDTNVPFVNIEKRKESVQSLEKVLEHINSIYDLQERKNHVIPFYLVEKKKIYENMLQYFFTKKDSNLRNLKKDFAKNKIK
jgi:hypothetical protein